MARDFIAGAAVALVVYVLVDLLTQPEMDSVSDLSRPVVADEAPIDALPIPIAGQPACDPDVMNELVALQDRTMELEEQLRKERGIPHDFPVGLPRGLRPDHVEETVVGAIQELDERFEMKHLDCEEYPCIVWVEAIGAVDEYSPDSMKQLAEELTQHSEWSDYGVYTFTLPRRNTLVSAGRMAVVLADGSYNPDLRRRASHRLDRWAQIVVNEPLLPESE